MQAAAYAAPAMFTHRRAVSAGTAEQPCNDNVGQFSSAQIARIAQNLSIRYKTGTAKDAGYDAFRGSRCIA